MSSKITIFDPPKYLAEDSDDLDVVTSPKEIAALAAKINKRLTALATISWIRKDKGRIDRDDSHGNSGRKRPTCKLFQYCFKDKQKNTLCKFSNEYHINLLKYELWKNNLLIDKKVDNPQKPSFFPDDYKVPYIVHNNNRGISYLEYNCPMMGYLELLFPIVIERSFLGTVCVGQILLRGNCESESIAQKMFEGFWNRYENEIAYNSKQENSKFPFPLPKLKKSEIEIFRDIRKAECSKEFDDILISCLTDGFKPLDNNEALLSKSFDSVAELIFDCVAELISELEGLVKKKREDLIRSVRKELFNETDETYRKSDKENLSLNTINSNYETVLRDTFINKMMRFGVKCIRFLGLKKNPLKKSDKMEVILSSERDSRENDRKIMNELSFDYFKYLKYLEDQNRSNELGHPCEPICSIVLSKQEDKRKIDESFFKYFQPEKMISKETHIVLLYQNWLVLIEANCCDSDSKIDTYALFLERIKRLMAAFIIRYELSLSKFVSEKYEFTLRLHRHECAQIARAISTRNNNTFRDLVDSIEIIKDRYKTVRFGEIDDWYFRRALFDDFFHLFSNIKDKNLGATCDDVDENIELIIHMADTTGLLTGKINKDNLDELEERSYFTIEHDIVTKWKKAHHNELYMKKRYISIVIDRNSIKQSINPYNYDLQSAREREIYHRKRLIDMVIYNLIDNALKYSHRGTKIHIAIGDQAPSVNDTVFPVTIENFGTFIARDPLAYELYYRGKTQTHIGGDGLGLYVAKEISDMLNLGISYTCKPIADYNIGLMAKFIKQCDENIKFAENVKYYYSDDKDYNEKIEHFYNNNIGFAEYLRLKNKLEGDYKNDIEGFNVKNRNFKVKNKDFAEYLNSELKNKCNTYTYNRVISIEDGNNSVLDISLAKKELEYEAYQSTYHVTFKLQVQTKSEI